MCIHAYIFRMNYKHVWMNIYKNLYSIISCCIYKRYIYYTFFPCIVSSTLQQSIRFPPSLDLIDEEPLLYFFFDVGLLDTTADLSKRGVGFLIAFCFKAQVEEIKDKRRKTHMRGYVKRWWQRWRWVWLMRWFVYLVLGCDADLDEYVDNEWRFMAMVCG